MKQVLFLAVILCGLAAFAEGIDINGDFKKIKKDIPVGWKQNKGSWAKPFGVVEFLQGDEGNAVKITNTDATKRTDFYSLKAIPVKAGDKVKLTIKVKGTGRAGVGVYVYTDKGKWCNAVYKYTELKLETTEFTTIVTIKDNIKKDKATIIAKTFKVVAQAIKPNTEVTFESIKVEILAAE